jgi:hypothetical protein
MRTLLQTPSPNANPQRQFRSLRRSISARLRMEPTPARATLIIENHLEDEEAPMSKKLNKQLRKYMKRRSAPKRIAGIKIPKQLRRAADTELGAAIIAQVLVGAAGTALMSPAAHKLRRRASKFARYAAEKLGDVTEDATGAVAGVFTPDAKRAHDTDTVDRAH